MAWYWHRVVELLERAGREGIAVDLPGDDENSVLDDYTMCPRKSCALAPPNRVSSRILFSVSLVVFASGPSYRCVSSPLRTIASSRLSFKDALPANASAQRST